MWENPVFGLTWNGETNSIKFIAASVPLHKPKPAALEKNSASQAKKKKPSQAENFAQWMRTEVFSKLAWVKKEPN